MTEEQIRKILDEYKRGALTPDEALHRLRSLPFEDLGFANIDHHRPLRQGFLEVVFGEGMTIVHVKRIVPLHAPSISSIEVVVKGKGRRALLYYRRDLNGNASRIKRADREEVAA